MEIKDMLENYGIIGIVSNYNSSLKDSKVKELNIKNISKALKMVSLDDSYLDKFTNELTCSEKFKIDLAMKLDKDIIIIGNLSKCLIYKDIEYIKKLLNKLNNDYHKKIIIIDEDINVFINLVKVICVMQNKKIIYSTIDFYDDKLYEYVKMPKIIDFVKYVNSNEKKLDNHLDIHELIKDIYRSLS